MTTYISILRGINVSGQKKMLMTDLKALYEDLGFSDVITYIQSGNVIFKTKQKATDSKLAKLIENKIIEVYNFQVPIIIRTVDEFQKVISCNPFIKEEIDNLYVTFLSNTPNIIHLEKLENVNYLPDTFEIINKEIYLSCSNYGNTKLSNNFFENKLKVNATTRNWKTILKLIELAENS